MNSTKRSVALFIETRNFKFEKVDESPNFVVVPINNRMYTSEIRPPRG
jgi:hypothetical protein